MQEALTARWIAWPQTLVEDGAEVHGWRLQHCTKLAWHHLSFLAEVNTLLFPAPDSSYDLNSFPEEARRSWNSLFRPGVDMVAKKS